MDYEIDFLPVGEGESSGDAICLRYTLDQGRTWWVGVIDGGTKDSGNALCEHIRQYYKTEVVNFVICTHPDQDHASGLAVVMDELIVQRLIMHLPWNYVDLIFEAVDDARVTKESLRERLAQGHRHAFDLYQRAVDQQIPIYDAFADSGDTGIPCLTIAGPSLEYYLSQLVNFRSITEVTQDGEKSALDGLLTTGRDVFNRVVESLNEETLVEPLPDATSPENNTSVISFFDFEGKRVLLTGDAGVPALEHAADRIERLGHPLGSFSFLQAPHHGSKRNVGPAILDRLIGPPAFGVSEPSPTFTSFISAAPDGEPKHPNKRVVNALIRRRAKVFATQGSKMCHFTPNVPDRGWQSVDPLSFSYEFDDDG